MVVPASTRAWSWAFRTAQLIAAFVVIVLASIHLIQRPSPPEATDIFLIIEAVAGVSIFGALVGLCFPLYFILWPIDLLFSLVWWAVFTALLFGTSCSNLYEGADDATLCSGVDTCTIFAIGCAVGWLLSSGLGFVGQWRIERQDFEPSDFANLTNITSITSFGKPSVV